MNKVSIMPGQPGLDPFGRYVITGQPRNPRAVGGWLEDIFGNGTPSAANTSSGTQLPGGSVLDIVTNRYLYDLRWNPILKQWVPKEYETSTTIPNTVTIGNKQVPWALIIGGVAAAGLLVWMLTRKR